MAVVTSQTVSCQVCDADVTHLNNGAEERELCPSCGSNKRNFDVLLESSISLVASLKWKHQRPGWRRAPESKKRPLAEGFDGWNVGRDGRLVETYQFVDRKNNRYKKLVKLPDGTVLRDVDEALDKHRSSRELRRQSEQAK